MPRLVWLLRQVAAEFGDGGVVVGQLLPDRQRLAVLGLRLRRPARLPTAARPRLSWLLARLLRKSVTAGLSSASFCADRQRLAVLGLRLRRLARLRQQAADAIDGVRQVVAGVVGGLGSGGQRLLVGPRQPVGRQGLGGLARGLEEPAHSRPAGRQRGPRRRVGARRAGQQRLRPPVGRQRLVRLAGRFEQPGDRDQAAADVDLWPRRRPPARPPAPREPPAPHGAPPARPRCGRPCPSGRPARSSDCASARREARSVSLPSRAPELAVEVGGRLQQPVAQLLELLLLEQEVLADAGVERLDRLDRQLVPLLDAAVGRGQLGVGFASRLSDSVRSAFLAASARLAWRCTAMTVAVPPTIASTTAAARAATAGLPPAPEPGPLGGADPPRRDRPAVEPGPQVVGQGLGAWRTAAAGPSPGTSGRSSPGRGARRR